MTHINERRMIAEQALLLNPGFSDRYLARMYNITREMISRKRFELIATGRIEDVGQYKGIDGKNYRSKRADKKRYATIKKLINRVSKVVNQYDPSRHKNVAERAELQRVAYELYNKVKWGK